MRYQQQQQTDKKVQNQHKYIYIYIFIYNYYVIKNLFYHLTNEFVTKRCLRNIFLLIITNKLNNKKRKLKPKGFNDLKKK